MPSSSSAGGRIVAGIILLLVGVYLLLKNFGLAPFELPPYLFSWQVLLILAGILMVSTREQKGGGILLILAGIIFLIHDMFYVSYKEILKFWPLLLILIGVGILLRQTRRKKHDV